jgi:hypothetical protein
MFCEIHCPQGEVRDMRLDFRYNVTGLSTFSLLSYPENEGSTFLRNTCNVLSFDKISHPGRQ